MKKLCSIFAVFFVAVVLTSCSLLPTATPVQCTVTQITAADLFQYDGLDYTSKEALVRIHPGVNVEQILSSEGSQILKEWNQIGWKLVSVPAGKEVLAFLEDLRKHDGVLMASPNLQYTLDAVPAAIQYDDQWGFQNIHAEPAWDIETGDPNVIVAIIDSGVDLNHSEFAGKTFIGAYNATDGTGDVTDYHGHGTHVAGIAADNGRTGRIAGVAWDCPVMPVKVMDPSGGLTSDYLIEAMIYVGTYAISHPEYRIVANMSIGGRGYDFALKDAIDYAALDGRVLLVTSAGNDYKRIPSYPGAYNGVVSVAASTPWDQRTDFSTLGPWNSVAAPGIRILSTLPNGGYDAWDGTSMASPFVAGAAALLLSRNASLTPLEVKNQLEQTARGTGYTEALGYGILDMQALLGPQQPMVYGSLNVATNIISTAETGWLGVGIITVFNASNVLVAYGTTGEDGNHFFHALKPGSYTINVGYYNQSTGNYYVLTKQASVTTGVVTNIDYTFNLANPPTRTLLNSIEVMELTSFGTTLSFQVMEAGEYEFETTFYTTQCDTVLYIADTNYNIIAQNDDYNGQYSCVRVTLQPGYYNAIIETKSKTPPLYCYFNVYQIP